MAPLITDEQYRTILTVSAAATIIRALERYQTAEKIDKIFDALYKRKRGRN